MKKLIITISIITFISSEEKKYLQSPYKDSFRQGKVSKIGDNPFPTNPMSDRAIGYLLQGKAQTAISNYGNIINWDEHPMGIWNGYSYLPSVAFLAGVPGHEYSSNFSWNNLENIVDQDGFTLYGVWESGEAYDRWFNNGDTTFVGILFDANEDDGIWQPDSIAKKGSKELFDSPYQWTVDHDLRKITLTSFGEDDPNRSTARIGFIYPWALRPKLIRREDQFDFYNYGEDLEEWTSDDEYMYYGFNVAESLSLIHI